MTLFGWTLERRKAADLITRLPEARGWWGTVRESFAGAWQRNIEVPVEDVLTHSTVWACLTLIAADISKLLINLIEANGDGTWTETESAAFSPVLRKPNHYQTRIKFLEQWILSKFIRGNAYILKERDGRGQVVALYVLDPTRVQVLVAPNGNVYYQLATDYLSGLHDTSVTVPASEIIHDIMVPLYHPLVGVSPFHACGRAALAGLKIQQNSETFFEAGLQLSGVLTAPTPISNEAAAQIEERWAATYTGANGAGKVAVVGDNMKFEPLTMTAVDAQLIDQLKWSDEKICSVLHVPPYMVGVGPPPNYNNIEALNQQYYSQCLQNPIECIELLLDEGLELPSYYGIEFDVEGGLLRMDTATRVKAAGDAIHGGLSPNEARWRYHGLGPVEGGDAVYMQQQQYSLAALNRRDQAGPPPPTPPPALPAVEVDTATKEATRRARLLLYDVKSKAKGLPDRRRAA